MAIKLIEETYCPQLDDYKKTYVADSSADAASLPESCPGSVAVVAANNAPIYMVNASGEWKDVSGGGSSGGGESGGGTKFDVAKITFTTDTEDFDAPLPDTYIISGVFTDENGFCTHHYVNPVTDGLTLNIPKGSVVFVQHGAGNQCCAMSDTSVYEVIIDGDSGAYGYCAFTVGESGDVSLESR